MSLGISDNEWLSDNKEASLQPIRQFFQWELLLTLNKGALLLSLT